MKKSKRILALVGVILIALLYLSTVVFALLGKEFMNWLMASVVTTVILPVLIWMYEFFYKMLHKDNDQ